MNYDVRLVDIGRWVSIPKGSDTYLHKRGYTGDSRVWDLPWGTFVALDDNVNALTKMAVEELDALPDMNYKFMLTYKEDEVRMFDTCCLIATNDSDWYQEYPVVAELTLQIRPEKVMEEQL